MATVVLATESDVEERLGRPLSAVDDARVSGLLVEASEIVAEWCGSPGEPAIFDTPTPARVSLVVSRMVARTLGVPAAAAGVDGPVSQGMGSITMTQKYSTDASSGSPWLTKQDRMLLRPYRSGISGAAFNVAMY